MNKTHSTIMFPCQPSESDQRKGPGPDTGRGIHKKGHGNRRTCRRRGRWSGRRIRSKPYIAPGFFKEIAYLLITITLPIPLLIAQ